MTIVYTGRRAALTPLLREFVEKKLTKLERFLGEIQDAHVILALEKHRYLAEVVVKARVASLAAKSESSDFRDAAAMCTERLLAQAKRHHDRLAKERKREGMRRSARRGGLPIEAILDAVTGSDNNRPPIVRMGRIPAKPMSVEEAALQVRDSRNAFLIFRNAESQQVAVIFRRPDGRYGLVEEEA